MEEIDVNRSLMQADLLLLFKNQLKKDFESAGIDADFTELPVHFDALKEMILSVLDPVFRNNTLMISTLLYRVDISEQQLQKYQTGNPTLSFDELLAELIVKRVLQKVILKKTFSKTGMSVLLRKGVESDLPRALELIKELAAFENAPDAVEVTPDEMINWGFGKDRIFEFFVLEKENVIVGMALYYYKYSTWKGKCLFLEDLIVTESERKNGYGKMLFDEVVKVAREQKVRALSWQVLDWNTPAIEFYKKYNAVLDEEWINCKLVFDQLQKL